MTIKYTEEFISQLKKQNVRVRKSFKKAINEFLKDVNSPILNNHELQQEWQGYRSIDITNDWRAIYRQVKFAGETVIYFISIGTHKQLYQSQS